MKYMLMMSGTKQGAADQGIGTWPKSDVQAHIRFMVDLNRELAGRGELVTAEGLAGLDEAIRVRAASDGRPVTDGVFPESKEFLAGYWIVDVDSRERAIEIAARASAAPGPGGEPLNMPIEVRQVMAGPPDDLL